MTGAEALVRKGRKEGRVEGRTQGCCEVLPEELEFKFGTLPEAVIGAVNQLTIEQGKVLIRQTLTAQTLEELAL